MPRRHRCDVPGCPNERRRVQRICALCWASLPREITMGIVLAWKQRRKADWKAWRRHAATARAGGRVPTIADSRTAYAQIARLTGDRDEGALP
jgi:hypothetical protein